MATQPRNPWSARLAAALIWAGAAALAVFWSMNLAAPRQILAVAQATSVQPVQVDPTGIARVLGVQALVPASAAQAPSRWRLLGVMVGNTSGGGAAAIALDDQPAKVYRVGAVVDDGLVLQALRRDAPRQVSLGKEVHGPALVTMALPEIQSTGASPFDAMPMAPFAQPQRVDRSTGVLGR